MTAINRSPKGLQSLLDTKSLGQNPSELVQVVAPVIDLSDFFYADSLLQAEEAATTFNSSNFQQYLAPIQIPVGETWAIKNVSSTCIFQVGASSPAVFDVIPVITPATRSTLRLPLTDANSTFGTLSGPTDAYVRSVNFERPLIVGNGAQISSWLAMVGSVTGDVSLFTQVGYYKLKT